MQRVVRRLALACGLALGPALAHAQPAPPVIRVGAAADDQNMALLYAQQAGLFAKAGVRVEISRLGGSAVIAAAIAGGTLDAGKLSSLSAVTAFAKGIPLTIVAGNSVYRSEAPDLALVVAAKSPLRSARDLAGKTLGASALQDSNSIATLAWLEAAGVPPGAVKFVETPAAALVGAIEAGRIDGATLIEPYYSAALTAGTMRVLGFPYDAIAKRFASGVIVADPAWAAAHADAVARFGRALIEASTYLAGHEREAIPLLAQFAGLDAAQLLQLHHPGRSATIEPAELQPVIDIALRYKLIPKSFAAQEMICTCAARAAR